MIPRIVFAISLLFVQTVSAANCAFASWMSYQGSPLRRHPGTQAYVFATTNVKVDADGAPNAYHPADVGLHCTRGTGFRGLDCPANAGYPNSTWWPNALLPDPSQPSVPYRQPATMAHAGYFVSRTTLQDHRKPAVDPTRYVDSRKVPYLVFPGAFNKLNGTGGMGDIGYAINLSNGKEQAFVVAEVGPSNALLGEMSIALGIALGGTDPNPRTGAGIPAGRILYVVFPKSRADPAWPVANTVIADKAKDLLVSTGGMAGLMACKDIL